MHDELTKKDLEKIQEEIDYRTLVLRPQLLEEVKRTRAFGDLSENFEYKEAKREKNRNDSRIRYLTNMIKTANVYEDTAGADTVGLYDKVECYFADDDETETVQIVTTIRTDSLQGLISKESPFGKALLGHRVGDEVKVESPAGVYTVKIRSIEKGEDDGSIPISSY